MHQLFSRLISSLTVSIITWVKHPSNMPLVIDCGAVFGVGFSFILINSYGVQTICMKRLIARSELWGGLCQPWASSDRWLIFADTLEKQAHDNLLRLPAPKSLDSPLFLKGADSGRPNEEGRLKVHETKGHVTACHCFPPRCRSSAFIPGSPPPDISAEEYV